MAAPARRRDRREIDPLEEPKGLGRRRQQRTSRDVFGRFSEGFARAMGTSGFLIGLTLFVAVWLLWNAVAPASAQFDPVSNGFAVLTLILSLQASYAAPLILLAQNRQDDRDRVQTEQDRQQAQRNLDDTEYLAREIVALRLLVRDMASKDFVRTELRGLLEELDKREADRSAGTAGRP
ncbi:DUF1003 domain-containing protein [Amnibacterium sp.]|uniref:DUF1003 domain-containing protein n=1 Tax=Amnibacterium sp. TaxID=1872496 RepID=UPI00260B1451|nr:DUF1003 domain-containing protein [Amnibacterium sp.]MCU1473582.1 hypothetical protein [Amnibacterium sp.]